MHPIFVQHISLAELSSPTAVPICQGLHGTCILGRSVQGDGGGVSIAGQERGVLHLYAYPGMDAQTDIEVSL